VRGTSKRVQHVARVTNHDGSCVPCSRNVAICCSQICMDQPRGTRFGPCRHASCCESCAERLLTDFQARCPICRERVVTILERGPQVAMQLTLQ
jgi:hypothetical protein